MPAKSHYTHPGDGREVTGYPASLRAIRGAIRIRIRDPESEFPWDYKSAPLKPDSGQIPAS